MDMVDRFPFFVEHKGKRGKIPWLPNYVYITSSKPPERCYKHSLDGGQEENWQQWTRRFETIELTESSQWILIDLQRCPMIISRMFKNFAELGRSKKETREPYLVIVSLALAPTP